jgi:lysophospholipase L1-like esterase
MIPSRGTPPGRRAAILAAALLGLAGSVAAQPLDRLGALGDSLTDEYDDQTFGGYARNWLELLAEQRDLDLGPTATEAGEPGGTWGEPRRAGYQENFGRSGADTDTAITQGQHIGVADGAIRGVTHAILFLGNNDFRPGGNNTFPYNAIYNNVWTAGQIEDHLDDSLADLATLLDPLEAAGLRIAIANAVDFGATPTVRLVFSNAANRDRVTAVLTTFSDRVRALAEARNLTFVDVFRFGQATFGTNTSPRPTLLVGNVAIQLGSQSGQSGNTSAFVEDGVHPHTVTHGVMANLMLAALDQHLGGCVAPFSEAELLAHNGLTYGGSDTLGTEIGPLSRFVESFPADGEPLFADGFECASLVAWQVSVP